MTWLERFFPDGRHYEHTAGALVTFHADGIVVVHEGDTLESKAAAERLFRKLRAVGYTESGPTEGGSVAFIWTQEAAEPVIVPDG